jgi:hypothetical protein
MYKILLFTGSLFLGILVSGQNNELNNNEIDFNYKERPTYPQKIGEEYNQSNLLHPEFGILPFDNPVGKNVVEVLEKRTSDERYYVDIDNPSYFYIQKGAQPINYQKDGNWLAISPFLEKKSPKLYKAENQSFPISIDLEDKKTYVEINGEKIGFNNYSISTLSNNGTVHIYSANWTNIEVGNKGAYITDIFPGIDMRIIFKEGAIKSDFIMHEETNFKSIQFLDEYEIPEGLYFEDTSAAGNSSFIYLKNAANGQEYAEIQKVKAYDHSASKEGWTFDYTIDQNKLYYFLDSAFLHNDSIVYPLTIDPLFTAVGPISAGSIGSLQAAALCSNSISINFPGGSQPWDVSANWQVETNQCFLDAYFGSYFPCFNSQAQISLGSSCGGFSPSFGSSWQCVGCNTPGTWTPTLPFNNIGTQSLAQCYTPSCNNQTMNFTLNLNRTSTCPSVSIGGNIFDGCQRSRSLCVSLNSWSITIQGRTLETLGNQPTGNGNTIITPVSCSGGSVTLDPTPAYGVPGYTYSWNTGGTAPTLTIPPFPYNGTTVSANVTDACGTSRTAQFLIQCPLAVSFTDFTIENLGESVLLDWSTETETENDYFEVYRSADGLEFEHLDQIQGAGNSNETINYNYKDERPLLGISYYKLGIVDMDGNREFTDIKTVQRNNENQNIHLIPNPATENVAIAFEFPTTAKYEVKIIDALGKERYLSKKEYKKGMQTINVNTKNFSQGVYTVIIVTKNNVNSARLIIQ